jgi:hypothetical protein
MRKVFYLLGVVCLCSLSAAAQEKSTVDLFGGYSYIHTGPGIAVSSFNANGGVGSVAFNLNNWGSLVAEVGGVHVSHINGADVDANAETFLFGPRISLFSSSKLTPFAQVLAGFARSDASFNRTTSSFNGFALSPGVGLDWHATRHVGLRLGQVDYLLTRMPTSTNQVNWNNFRYSAGVLLRF